MAEQQAEGGQVQAEEVPEATQAQAQRLADQGYDVSVRGGSLIIETPNPRVTDDDYFHGENPHTEGFGSRGGDWEGAAETHAVEPGQSTADAQNAQGGLGWNQQAGATGDVAQSGSPDESWTNARIRDYADQNNIDVSGAGNKRELLDAVRSGRTSE